ncbi:MAG: hypothetical protein RBS37_05250 [Bacteroidales bacterium]|jgi:hypothetical protein|nr:hypothetical protein [Bacteroidales bacterium]
MSKSEKKAEPRNDEIDLIDLFNRMGKSLGRGFKALGRASLHIIAFLFRKWLWLGISILLGIALAFIIKFSTERLYTSDITLRSNAIRNADMIEYINKLHTFCREENYAELAAAMAVPEERIRFVKDIRAYWVIDMGSDFIPDHVDFRNNHDVLDTINIRMQDRFVIRVKISGPQELSSIRDGIIRFVHKNDFFQQQNELRLQQNKILLSRFGYEIEQLDSLQKVKYFEESRRLMPGEGGQMIFLQDYKTQLLHDDIYLLYQRQQDVERQMTIYSDLITLLSDFTPPARPENGALYYGKRVIPAIFLLTAIILLLIDNRQKIRNTFKKY